MKNKKIKIIGTFLSITLALSGLQISAQAQSAEINSSTVHSSVTSNTENSISSQQFYLPEYCLKINPQKSNKDIIDLNSIILKYKWVNLQINVSWKIAEICSTVDDWKSVIKFLQPIMSEYSSRSVYFTKDYDSNLKNTIKNCIIFARYYHALAEIAFYNDVRSFTDYDNVVKLFKKAVSYYKKAIDTYNYVYPNFALEYDKTELAKEINTCSRKAFLTAAQYLGHATDINSKSEAWKKFAMILVRQVSFYNSTPYKRRYSALSNT